MYACTCILFKSSRSGCKLDIYTPLRHGENNVKGVCMADFSYIHTYIHSYVYLYIYSSEIKTAPPNLKCCADENLLLIINCKIEKAEGGPKKKKNLYEGSMYMRGICLNAQSESLFHLDRRDYHSAFSSVQTMLAWPLKKEPKHHTRRIEKILPSML